MPECLFNPRRFKAFNFDNYDNSHNIFLSPEYFIDFLCERWIPCQDPISGCDIRLVFILSPRDSTLQYKRCVHIWNNFPCIITLIVPKGGLWTLKMEKCWMEKMSTFLVLKTYQFNLKICCKLSFTIKKKKL